MEDIMEKAKKILNMNSIIFLNDDEDTKRRNESMKVLYEGGMSIVEIGKVYGISRQRVSKILHALEVSPNETLNKRAEQKLVDKYKERAKRYLRKARHNSSLFKEAHIQVLSLQTQLKLKNKTLKEVENFVNEIKKYKLKVAQLSSQLTYKTRRVEKLEEEIKELKSHLEQDNK